jgi:uncharacterized protein (TIGR03435 family)
MKRKVALTRIAGNSSILIFAGWMMLAPQAHGRQKTNPDAVAPAGGSVAPAYDVASIKKYVPDGSPMMVKWGATANGFVATHMTLKSLVCFAYDVNSYQVSGGPNWSESDMYDVNAKMDDSTIEVLRKLDSAQARQTQKQMLQALLADRFRLSIHRETRQLPIYALIVLKGGHKMHSAAPDDAYPNGFKGIDGKSGKGIMRMRLDGNGSTITAQGVTVKQLVDQLSGSLDALVQDQTGLTGSFDFTLRYAPDELQNASNSDASAPSIFTALQEQLGLKLESRKGPVEVLIIDHVERPSEN